MNGPTPCPDPVTLRRFLDGGLDAGGSERIGAHLVACPDCRSRLGSEGTSAGDASGRSGGSTDAATLRQAGLGDDPDWIVTRAETTVTAPWADGEDHDEFDDVDLTFLEPTTRTGALGRVGSLEVLGLVGTGGMGVVLRAFDPALRRHVAVKTLNARLAGSRRARRRFLREARSAAAINHPNIVTIHAVEVQNDTPYLVMELVDGRSLRELIHEAPLDPADVLRIGLQVAHGLAAAHAHGVIHRDVKPANIMLEAGSDRVKITDFGLALAAIDNSNMTSADQQVGTPAYMSPEQVEGRPVDPRSDLFSLGCVLYAALTGASPFRGSTTIEVLRKVVDMPHVPPRDVRPDAPIGLCEIIDRLLEKNPDRRYATADEAAEALRKRLMQFSQDSMEAQRLQAEAAAPPAPPSRRKLAPLLISGAALALLLFLGVWLSGQGWRRPEGPLDPNAAKKPAEPVRPAHVPGRPLVVGPHDAPFGSIRQALAAARPNDVIRLAPGTYGEAVIIDDPDRLSGLTIDAEGSVLQAPPGSDAVIRIENVARVTVRGARLSTDHVARGVVLAGKVGGTTLEGLTIDRTGDADKPAIALKGAYSDSDPHPITIRACRIDASGNAVFATTENHAIEHVVFEDCRFVCPDVHIVLLGTARDMAIRRCLFLGGLNGVNLDLPTGGGASGIVLDHNTFLGTRWWMGLVFTKPEPGGLVAKNNMILGSERIEWSRPAQVGEAADAWTFEGNVWEATCETDSDATAGGRIARPVEFAGVISRDPDDANYLRPAAGSPAAGAGVPPESPALRAKP